MIEALKTIGGILIFLAPFLLIFSFKDRRDGFLHVLIADIAFHIAVALITQASHIFFYPVVLGLNIAATAAAGFLMLKKKKLPSFKISVRWQDAWPVAAAFLIIFFNLWSAHYDYSGLVSTTNRTEFASHSRYSYPYFSDEWSGVAYIDYSLSQNSLPAANPLIDGYGRQGAPDVFMVFFALLAELCLLLNIVPLTGYAVMALGAGMLICYLIYRLMRENGIRMFPSLIAAMTLPYIINGGNMPGLWYLLPFNGGMILFLSSLIALTGRKMKIALWSGFLSLLLYPPLVILLVPALAAWLLSDKESSVRRKRSLLIFGVMAVFLAAAVIFLIQEYSLKDFWILVASYLWRPSLDSGIASFPIWRILPLWILPFSLFGLMAAFREKKYFLIAPLLTGLCLWLFYNYSSYFFIIDYARAVMITSWLLIAFAGFGLDQLSKILERPFPFFFKKTPQLFMRLLILALFLITAFSYTERTAWMDLTLTVDTPRGLRRVIPSAPAGDYLKDDDLRLFSLVPKNSRFISPPWKGLAIGAATDNYPMDSKPSIITNSVTSYSLFLTANCEGKAVIAKKFRISYAYSAPFDCAGFSLIGFSREGLHLYKIPSE